jgi:hypothetical protein
MAVELLRKSWCLPNDALLCEDFSPTHVGDKCKRTGDTGLRAKRIEALQAVRSWREITPRRANPRYGINDNTHKDVHLKIQRRVYEKIGFQRRLQDRPRGHALRRGGPYVTKSGYRRGCTPYQFCQAVHETMTNYPREHVNSAYIRCGWLSVADVASITKQTPEQVEAAVGQLEGGQDEIKRNKKATRCHEAHDFSGQPHRAAKWLHALDFHQGPGITWSLPNNGIRFPGPWVQERGFLQFGKVFTEGATLHRGGGVRPPPASFCSFYGGRCSQG